MAEDMVRRLVSEQRKRLVAGLMNAVEAQPWYSRLTPSEKATYRQDVLSRVGVYHDFMLDVIKVNGEDTVVNGHALDLIEQVHAGQQRIEGALSVRAVRAGG
jgi:hypothetical protein